MLIHVSNDIAIKLKAAWQQYSTECTLQHANIRAAEEAKIDEVTRAHMIANARSIEHYAYLNYKAVEMEFQNECIAAMFNK